jgi:hypothetical protein
MDSMDLDLYYYLHVGQSNQDYSMHAIPLRLCTTIRGECGMFGRAGVTLYQRHL